MASKLTKDFLVGSLRRHYNCHSISTIIKHCQCLKIKTLCTSGGFIVDANWTQAVIDWNPISESICVLKLRGKFLIYSIINAYAPQNERIKER